MWASENVARVFKFLACSIVEEKEKKAKVESDAMLAITQPTSGSQVANAVHPVTDGPVSSSPLEKKSLQI